MGKAVSIEDIVSQDHGAGFLSDELPANQECLGKTIRRGLHRIAQMHAKMGAVPQQLLKPGRIRRSGDDQNI